MPPPPLLPVFRLQRSRSLPFIPVRRLRRSPQPEPLLRRALQRVLPARLRSPAPPSR